MRKKKIEKFVEKKVEERIDVLVKTDPWVLLRTLESDMTYVRPELERLKGTVNSMWGLPVFNEYRGKK